MNIDDFVVKYNISTPQSDGLKHAAKFYARSNFHEKLLIFIYITVFGVYPGNIEETDMDEDLSSLIGNLVNDEITAVGTTWSSQKLVEQIDLLATKVQLNSQKTSILSQLTESINSLKNKELVEGVRTANIVLSDYIDESNIGKRYLLMGQDDTSENGIYEINADGKLQRTEDANSWEKLYRAQILEKDTGDMYVSTTGLEGTFETDEITFAKHDYPLKEVILIDSDGSTSEFSYPTTRPNNSITQVIERTTGEKINVDTVLLNGTVTINFPQAPAEEVDYLLTIIG
ncbi:MAG: hypothetical protein AAF518_17520 [Spirochaetota bacterium]